MNTVNLVGNLAPLAARFPWPIFSGGTDLVAVALAIGATVGLFALISAALRIALDLPPNTRSATLQHNE